jgi:hypothetical protein
MLGSVLLDFSLCRFLVQIGLISVAKLGDILPIGLHLCVTGYKKFVFATFYFCYILGDIGILSKLFLTGDQKIEFPNIETGDQNNCFTQD